MKIKTKKQLNLPQLIEWAMDNEIKDRMFLTESAYCVGFDKHGFIYFNSTNCMPLDQLFTVEVEEEITEDTQFDLMIEIVDGTPNCLWEKASIEDWKDEDSKEFHAYIDGEFKLIWRDGKLIEE